MQGRCCCTPLSVSRGISQRTHTLFFSFSRSLGLDWFSLPFLSVPLEVLKGVDYLAVQARPAAVLLGKRQRRSRARERSPIWLSPSVNTKGRREKGPRWAGKWMALTSSNLRKHLHLLIKIEWKKVISVQDRPSSLKLIKCTSLHCSLYLSKENVPGSKGKGWCSWQRFLIVKQHFLNNNIHPTL